MIKTVFASTLVFASLVSSVGFAGGNNYPTTQPRETEIDTVSRVDYKELDSFLASKMHRVQEIYNLVTTGQIQGSQVKTRYLAELAIIAGEITAMTGRSGADISQGLKDVLLNTKYDLAESLQIAREAAQRGGVLSSVVRDALQEYKASVELYHANYLIVMSAIDTVNATFEKLSAALNDKLPEDTVALAKQNEGFRQIYSSFISLKGFVSRLNASANVLSPNVSIYDQVLGLQNELRDSNRLFSPRQFMNGVRQIEQGTNSLKSKYGIQ